MEDIDFKKWNVLITRDPLWYEKIFPEIQELIELKKIDPERYEVMKEKAYDFFESHIRSRDILFGPILREWDKERLPIDTIVLHHTSNLPGLTPERLSGMELFRLYTPYFINPRDEEDKVIQHQPIFSGHERDGAQIFWPYHWIIRKGGTVERLLRDDEVGWHAGNWNVNCRSIAIVFDNDYEESIPPEEELNAAAHIVREYYPRIQRDRIFGHCEINTKTTCPSKLFCSDEKRKGWKDTFLNITYTS